MSTNSLGGNSQVTVNGGGNVGVTDPLQAVTESNQQLMNLRAGLAVENNRFTTAMTVFERQDKAADRMR